MFVLIEVARHYWVIDALDECSAAERRNYDNLFTMLSKIDDRVLLKVFLTSRPSSDLERLLAPLPVVSEQITSENTQVDIRMYVENHSEDLPEETRESLIHRIVEKSSGCFLWTVLVMQQLQDVYSLEETEGVGRDTRRDGTLISSQFTDNVEQSEDKAACDDHTEVDRLCYPTTHR